MLLDDREKLRSFFRLIVEKYSVYPIQLINVEAFIDHLFLRFIEIMPHPYDTMTKFSEVIKNSGKKWNQLMNENNNSYGDVFEYLVASHDSSVNLVQGLLSSIQISSIDKTSTDDDVIKQIDNMIGSISSALISPEMRGRYLVISDKLEDEILAFWIDWSREKGYDF